ncbi:anti-sigma factor [Sphingomonas sp. 1P06PA]|uniref:anti-sigma factor n=1 Tax=Sphingomonas sp. 1P06PA TaxID=554121 RepID=UPI0039A4A380
MSDPLDLAAAEYVLGTLDPAERATFLARLARDPAAVDAVAAWRDRLAPLLLTAPEAEADPHIWSAIERRMAAPAAANDNRVGWWRGAAIAASLIAIASSTALVMRPAPAPVVVASAPRPDPVAAMAALSPSGGAPAMLISYHPMTRRMEIVPIAMPPGDGHSHELWLIGADGKPRSMGVLAARGRHFMPADLATGPKLVLAVSVEPMGGSPTGSPTGPVVLSGEMMPMPKPVES